MNPLLYFYLEPYVYISSGKNGVLLVNLLDDKAFIFSDFRAVEIINQIQSSDRRLAQINEDEKSLPLIKTLIENFMGEITSSFDIPLQFDSELNNISGTKAYERSIIYSRCNIGSFISECTIFMDMSHFDCTELISYETGITSIFEGFKSKYSIPINNSELCTYVQNLIDINPKIKINLCGFNIGVVDIIIDKFPKTNFNLVVSSKTIECNPHIKSLLDRKTVGYTVLLDLSKDEIIKYAEDANCPLKAKVTNEYELNTFIAQAEDRSNVTIVPMLCSYNYSFIKEMLSLSVDDLLQISNKYRTIKANNLINTNLWGKAFLFQGGNVYFSIGDVNSKHYNSEELFENFKHSLFNGSIDWAKTRTFERCKLCEMQYLCPSPTYIECYMRKANMINCLAHNR